MRSTHAHPCMSSRTRLRLRGTRHGICDLTLPAAAGAAALASAGLPAGAACEGEGTLTVGPRTGVPGADRECQRAGRADKMHQFASASS